MRSRFAPWFAVLSMLWVGLVLGISFVATPAKFAAPTLDLPTALDVGRHTFAVSHVVQLIVAALLAVCVIGSSSRVKTALFVAIGVLLVQHVIMLPILSARAGAIIGGATVEGSSVHLIYIVLEVAKLAAAALAGVWALQARDPRPDQRVAAGVELFGS